MRYVIAHFLVVALAVGAPTARALEAETLRQDVIRGLGGGLSPSAGGALGFDEVAVSGGGDRFRVEIRGLRVSNDAKEFQIDLGTWAFAVEATADGLYRIADLVAPGRVSIRNPEGESGAATYAFERFSGLWSPTLFSFLDLDMALRDFTLDVGAGGFKLSLPSLTSKTESRSLGDGLIDQTATALAVGLRAAIPEIGRLEVGEIYGETTFGAADLAAYQAIAAEMRTFESKDAAAARQALPALVERLTADNLLPERLAQRFKIAGLTLSDETKRKLFSVDELEFDFGASGLKQNAARARLGLKTDGLAFNPGPEFAGATWLQLLPRNASFVIALDALPSEALWLAFARALAEAAAAKDESGADLAFTAFSGEAMAAISRAGTKLSLPHLVIDAPIAGLTADGIIEADAAAPNGAKGLLNIGLTGLDQVIALAGGSASEEDRASVGMLFMLKGMARRETGADGVPVDRLALELTPAGEFLVNGQPFALMP